MVVFTLLLPVPILFGVYVHSTFQTKQEEFVVVSTKKFELSSEIFSESLWNFYPELGKTMVHQLSLDKSFVSVNLSDARGDIFISHVNQTVTNPEEMFMLEKVLTKNETDIGTLTMVFKKEGLLESIKSDFFLFGSIALLQAIMIVVVISFIYYYKIIKPMRRLVQDSKKLALKELDEPFVWKGKDEINSLGRALDATRIALNDLFSTLITQNATLDEKVQQRTKELEEASRYKSEFLANMSHEIRTPMNAIVGMCHLISKTLLNDAQSNYIIKIKDASSVLLRIINDILDFSKIEAGKLSIEYIAFDMHKELKKSASIFSILAKDKEIELESDFVHTHRFYKGDPYRIVQIVNNFLSNAIKFTNKGKVTLSVKEEEASQNKKRLVFSVTDTGMGIAEEKKSKLFKAFGQLDASTTRKHGGTGLGLYICTQLADMMGGKITFDSQEGEGSTFNLEILLEKAEGLDVQKENGLDLFIPINILLIEDDKNSRNIIREYIRSFGFFITIVDSYEKAVEKIEETKEKFDLLIIDYHLPTVDGITAYNLLKKKMHHRPPAIMITVDEDGSLKSKAINSGFERFLVKPINPSFLYDDITSLCNIEKADVHNLHHAKIDFSDKTILIVEDNDINLEVAMYLLKETEAHVEIARNGFEAVEKVRQKTYDAILMDIQMPVMDGYEATKIIRKELMYTKPIVAMTANVMSHDVKKCIEIGMNEHIGKPLEVEDFYGTLLKVFDKIPLSKPRAKAMQEDVCFDKNSAIKRLSNNVSLWEKTFCKFYDKYENLIADINQLLENNDSESLKIYAHTLKGLCGTIGANRLQKEAYAIELQVKDGIDIKNISFEKLFFEYSQFFENTKDIFDTNCKEIEIKKETQISNDEIIDKLSNLETALEMSSVSKVKQCIEKLSSSQKIVEHELFKAIVIHCETFDFEAAINFVKQLKKEIRDV